MIEFSLLRPYWLLALLPLGFVCVLLWHRMQNFSNWNKICDPHLLPHLLINTGDKQSKLPLILLILAWCLTVIALAGPSFQRSSYNLYRNTLPLVIAVDLSEDMYATDIRPNRINRLRYKLLDIIEEQAQGQIGMLAFTKETYTISPLTEDSHTLSTMIPELDPKIMPVTGCKISRAIKTARDMLEQSGEHKGHILLITSGQIDSQDYAMAEKSKQAGYPISVYAIGTAQGAPLVTEQGLLKDNRGNIRLAKIDAAKLKHLARSGGGRYIEFQNSNRDVDAVISLMQTSTEHQRLSKQTMEVRHDQGHWIILLLLPLAALAFRKGWYEGMVSQ